MLRLTVEHYILDFEYESRDEIILYRHVVCNLLWTDTEQIPVDI